MTKIRPIYKCRRCGQRFEGPLLITNGGTVQHSVNRVITAAMVGKSCDFGDISLLPVISHNKCKEGGYYEAVTFGIADIIGVNAWDDTTQLFPEQFPE